ncbi:hypothetical protein CJF32_00011345 [Rutstroemia sp. NJR-2017a WRK4]|nr:hypothetical protein CJF32_00011345 [Rutstroemia sp. NJR-2017a WRK4]
MKKQTI